MSRKRRHTTGLNKLFANRERRVERGARKLAAKQLRATQPKKRWF